MADQLFQPDEYGSFDDWSDFHPSLVDETLERHRIDPVDSTHLRRGNHTKAHGSSIWKNDGPKLESAEANAEARGRRVLKSTDTANFVDFPEATGDPLTMLESLHPLSSGLNDIGIHDRDQGIGQSASSSTGIMDRLRAKERDAEDSAKRGIRSAKNEIRDVKDRTESGIHRAVQKTESGISKAAHKTESAVKGAAHKTGEALERAKDKTEHTMERVKDTVEGQLHKAKDEVVGLSHNVKEKISPQRDQPEITVLENATVVVEDWDKHKEEKPSFWQQIKEKLHFSRAKETPAPAPSAAPIPTTRTTFRADEMHHGPRIVSPTPKNNANLEIPPKETDASMLDMVGAQKQKIDQFTVVNDKTTGGPYPASHIPSKMRVDQSNIEDLKSYAHGAYGQGNKDYYGGNQNIQASGNPNTSR